ncbi:flavin reductase family protein [Corynebacterium bovis]|uniref:Flavin reductase n=1 Tax=Corynebacterium bovis TaxID=36808 RepID=A0A426PWA4_9CORY|nr:flavin reductase family protein [Corynebacterium bovis]MDN8579561.1 flavin reductase family protein [Corynebacterium bovis]RRO85615.1 flavin reductase [Corynebacterium bovis]RRO89454.1 flavin reductase [Corynebacterium bovis]
MAHLSELFRTAFRHHPTGVALITARVGGEPVGITASSVASLAVDPLAVSFSLTKREGSAGAIYDAESYLIHFLGEDHADVAYQFSRSGGRRFTPDQPWETVETGEPMLTDALTVMRAVPEDRISVGQSTLIAARVTDILRAPEDDTGCAAAADRQEPAPLMFRAHKFYRFPVDQPPL